MRPGSIPQMMEYLASCIKPVKLQLKKKLFFMWNTITNNCQQNLSLLRKYLKIWQLCFCQRALDFWHQLFLICFTCSVEFWQSHLYFDRACCCLSKILTRLLQDIFNWKFLSWTGQPRQQTTREIKLNKKNPSNDTLSRREKRDEKLSVLSTR